jgi:hypothetical protein
MATIVAIVLSSFTACGSSSDSNVKSPHTGGEDSQGNSIQSPPKITHDNKKYRLLAWNDLGMHCMDGSDYSVFSILPPYNNLLTQLVRKSSAASPPTLIMTDVNISYQAVASFAGKYNTTSANKTNFWQYTSKLFNAQVAENIGLKGNPVQSLTPAPLSYKEDLAWWSAEGIPTVPRDDDGSINEYPMVRVVAKDTEGKVLAETITVLPVSDEMDCKKCHSSHANYTATKPNAGYVKDQDTNKDYKYNILRLHDQKHPITQYLPALKDGGYTYQSSLEQTAREGTPILCASCHKSNALGTKGLSGIPALSAAIHGRHAHVTDPKNGQKLEDSTNRNACYACHPGAETQCLRGAMGNAKDASGKQKMQCQSCHGSMSAMGSREREGWLEEPNCQVCHQDGKRFDSAVIDMKKGTLRAVLEGPKGSRFATNPNTPKQGVSLYRYSRGHGGLQCAACHGATHAIYSSAKKEDNLESINAQGHAGTIAECSSCHKYMPSTSDGGPHGMHSLGVSWVQYEHESAVVNNGSESCKSCHGADLKGSALSKVFAARSMAGKTFEKGHQVSCYDCHDGPTGIGY